MKLPSLSKPKTLAEARTRILNLSRSMHENVYLIGIQLLWVKNKVGHGKFDLWVENNVKLFKKRTAIQMMRYAER